MPVCFTLINKNTGLSDEGFAEIDDKICQVFGMQPDTYRWVFNWYNCLGMLMAMGRSYQELKEIYEGNNDLLQVIDWLEDNYIIDYWRE